MSPILFYSDTFWPSIRSSGCWFDGILQGSEVTKDLLFYLRSYSVEGPRQMGHSPLSRDTYTQTFW